MRGAPRRVGRPAASTSAETRERILAAAEKCFGRYGYDKTSNKDIADEAGLTTGALYHYFDSKQELFLVLVKERYQQIVDSYRDVADGAGSATEKLCAILDRAVQWSLQDENLARFAWTSPIEIERHPEFGLSQSDAWGRSGGVATLLTDIIKHGVSNGELPADTDVAGTVNMFLAACAGLAQLAAFLSDEEAHRGAVDAFKLLLLGRLFRAEEPRPLRRRRAG